jgi:hypothetical protein
MLTQQEFRLFEEIKEQIKRLATAMEQNKDVQNFKEVAKEVHKIAYTKENILKHTSEDELFALFHTFKEYYNELQEGKHSVGTKHILDAGSGLTWSPLDKDIGEVITKLKANYK